MGEAYDLELDRILNEAGRLSARRILIQLPDGLKPYAPQIVEKLADRGLEVYVSASSCYGACDLALAEAERLKADLLVHYGHTSFGLPTGRIKVLYVEARSSADFSEVLSGALPELKPYRRIGLTASLQHVHRISEVEKSLRGEGKQVFVGRPEGRGVAYPGQILGCNVSAALKISGNVEVFIHLGGGLFHPLGVFLATGKPVFSLDPFTGKVVEVSGLGERVKRKLKSSVMRVLEAERVGVILGLKPGQFNLREALKVKRVLEERGKQVLMLGFDEVLEEALANFPSLEAFVCTACPRIGVDDCEKFSRPLIPASNLLEALGHEPGEN